MAQNRNVWESLHRAGSTVSVAFTVSEEYCYVRRRHSDLLPDGAYQFRQSLLSQLVDHITGAHVL